MRSAIFIAALGSVFLVRSFCQQSPGCRELTQQIWYGIAPGRGPHVTVVTATMSTQPGALVIRRNGKFYGTTDSGSQWHALSGTPWTTLAQLPESLFVPSDPQIVYTYENIGIVKRSTDGGRTWTIPQPQIDGISGSAKASAISGDRSYVPKVQITGIHPLQPLTIYGTIRVVPPAGSEANFDPRYFLKGMYISEDGGDHWERFSEQVGIFDQYPRDVVLGINTAAPNIMFSEGEHGILRSTDGGSTWLPVGQNDLLNQEPLDTQDRAEGVLVPRRKGALSVSEFVFDPSSTRIVYIISQKGIHRSLDGGDTWVLLNLGFDKLHAVNSLVVDPLQPHRLFAGTDRGLFVSEDRGCAFSKVPLPDLSPEGELLKSTNGAVRIGR